MGQIMDACIKRDGDDDMLEAIKKPDLKVVAEATSMPLIDDTPKPITATKGWCSYWVLVLLSTTTTVMAQLTFPDIAVAYFNGGVDPCVGPGGKDSPLCVSTLEKVTSITTAFRTGSAILSLVCSPFVGLAADYFGRKPLILTSLGVSFLQFWTLSAVALYNVNIYWCYASIELTGLIPIDVLLQLYIADSTETKDRAPTFAKLFAMTSLSILLGPIPAMVLDIKGCLITLLVLGVIVMPLAACCVKESRPPQKAQTEASDADQTIRARFAVLVKLMKHPMLRSISLLYLAGQVVVAGLQTIFQYYFKERFGMDLNDMAPYLLIMTFSTILGNLFLVKPLIRYFGLKGIIIISYCMGTLTCSGFAIAQTPAALYVSVLIGGAANLHMSAVQAIWTNAAAKEGKEIGVTLGAITSLYSFAQVVGPLLFTACFDGFQPFAGSPFVLGVVIDIISIVMWMRIPSSAFPDHVDDEQVSM